MIQPDEDPLVFTDTNAAKQALQNGQVDAILADVPTAFYITAVEIPQGQIVGQFQPSHGRAGGVRDALREGQRASSRASNAALAEMREDGTLADIEQEWLSDVVDVPVLE